MMIQERDAVARALGKSMSEVDKTFSASFPIKELSVCGHYIWIVTKGGFEVRNERSAEVVFQGTNRAAGNGTVNVMSILAVPDPAVGLQVWMGLSNGAVEVYDAQTFGVLRQQTKHAGGVYCLAEFGGYVYSGSSDFKIGQWYAADARLVRMLHGHSNYVRCLYAEGNAVVSGSDDCTVRVWDVGSGDAQLTGRFHDRSAVSALCRVGITMWSGDDSGRVVVWRLDTCEALHILQAHSGRVSSLKKVGSRVYSGGADGVIAVFDAEEGRLLSHVNNYHGVRVSSLVVTSELRRFCIWSSSADKMIQCWHQDEYTVMIGDQERFSERFWYETGSTPYREFRDSVLKHIGNLRETLKIRTSDNPRLVDIVGLSNSASTVEGFRKREAILNKELSSLEGRQASLESQLEQSKGVLENIEKETSLVLGILRAAQAELRSLDPVLHGSLLMSAGGDANGPLANIVSTLSGQPATMTNVPNPPGNLAVPTSTAATTSAWPAIPSAAAVGSGAQYAAYQPTAIQGHPFYVGTPATYTQPASVSHPVAGVSGATVSNLQSPVPPVQVCGTTPAGVSTAQIPGGQGVAFTALQPAGTMAVGGPTGSTNAVQQVPTAATSAQPLGTAAAGAMAGALPPGQSIATTSAQPLGTAAAGTMAGALPPGQSIATTSAQPLGTAAAGTMAGALPPGQSIATTSAQPPSTLGVGGSTGAPTFGQNFAVSLQPSTATTSVGPAGLTSSAANMAVSSQPLGASTVVDASGPLHSGQSLTGSAHPLSTQASGKLMGTASAGESVTTPFQPLGATANGSSLVFTTAGQSLTAIPQSLGVASTGQSTAQIPGGQGVAFTALQPAGTMAVGGPTGSTNAVQQVPTAATTPSGTTAAAMAGALPPGQSIATTSAQPLGTAAAGGPAGKPPVEQDFLSTKRVVPPVSRCGTAPPSKHVHFEQVAEATTSGGVVYRGVEWTNKNVGNYIQRRYYGAEPSLRTPALEKRRRLQGRMPDVKLEPFKRKDEG
ncbi:WD domain [Trypanosoma brucei equiperdum]|uniref:WD domain n=1 Tax=Trypanosoma brucei equiperdum TaxID=630700 RepID=A0A3L6L4I0_9TRYP|nr:WD domain [Trypanosoma brucei equiperdum]